MEDSFHHDLRFPRFPCLKRCIGGLSIQLKNSEKSETPSLGSEHYFCFSYIQGSRIEGCVLIKVVKRTCVSQIWIDLVGLSDSKWFDHSRFGGTLFLHNFQELHKLRKKVNEPGTFPKSVNTGTTIVRCFRDQEVFHRQRRHLFGDSSIDDSHRDWGSLSSMIFDSSESLQMFVLPVGVHKFEFEFELPHDLPSSCVLADGMVTLSYYLRTFICEAYQKPLLFSQPINVPHNSALQFDKSNLALCQLKEPCLVRSSVTKIRADSTLAINRCVFGTNEVILVYWLRVQNLSSKSIGISVNLNQVTTFKGHCETTTKVQVHSRLVARDTVGVLLPGGTSPLTGNRLLALPSNLVPSDLSPCSNVQLEYFLELIINGLVCVRIPILLVAGLAIATSMSVASETLAHRHNNLSDVSLSKSKSMVLTDVDSSTEKQLDLPVVEPTI